MASEFNPKDIGPNDYVVVLAPKTSDDECYFNVPGRKEKVWIARTHVIRFNTRTLKQIYTLGGYFAYNGERDLTKPFLYHNDIEYIDFEESSLVAVFSYEDNFNFTHENVKELKEYIKKLPYKED
jgi:hypothetical protein